MDTELSDMYMFVCLRVKGRNLDARTVNPLLVEYNTLLREMKIEEKRDDGKIFKARVQSLDEYQHEILDKDTLLCSRQIRWNVIDPIYNPYSPSSPRPNSAHNIHARLHEAVMKIRVQEGKYSKKIVIETVNTHVPGNTRTGRWPEEPLFKTQV